MPDAARPVSPSPLYRNVMYFVPLEVTVFSCTNAEPLCVYLNSSIYMNILQRCDTVGNNHFVFVYIQLLYI